MAKKTKTQQVTETIEAVNNVLEVVEIAANNIACNETVETVTDIAVVTMCPATIANGRNNDTTTTAISRNDIALAIETLQNSVKTLKKEAITLRSLVRCICDNANNVNIAPLAKVFGLTETSNKAERNNVITNICNNLPYYATTTGDGAMHTTPMKLTKKADNIYIASIETNYFTVLSDVINNVVGGANIHVEVKSGKYYDNNGNEIDDQKSAKAMAKAEAEAKKEEKNAKAIENAKALLGIDDIVTLDAAGLLVRAMQMTSNIDALKHIAEAVKILTAE